MVTAYVSWLEHVMVLLVPFVGGLPADKSIKQFIGDRWSLKFQQVFDLGDRVTRQRHDTLREIVEDYRNPYSHGGFDKAGSAIAIQLPGLGPLPMTMTDNRRSPTFHFVPADMHSFSWICQQLDEFDDWLSTGVGQHGMIYIEEGLDVAFDPAFISEVTRRSSDLEGFREWANTLSLYRDDMENMDW